MRVAQVAYKADIAGGEQVVLQLCRALAEAGHEPVMVVPRDGPMAAAARAAGWPVHLSGFEKTYDLAGAMLLAAALRRLRVDLVHSHGMLVNVLSRVAASRARIPSVSTVHLTRGMGGPMRALRARDRWKARLWYRPLDNATAGLAAAVVAVSGAVRDDLIAQGYAPELVRVIRNGIDPSPFDAVPPDARLRLRAQLDVSPDEVLVGMVARLSPQKDVGTFLDALSLARQRAPGLKAFVAGDGVERGRLEARVARDHALRGQVHLLGRRGDVPELLAASDLVALTSRWEGLPLTVLEAMAARRAVVATEVPGTLEALDDNVTGLRVRRQAPLEVANALVRLARDAQQRAAMGAAGRVRLDRMFHVRRTAAEHLSLYRELTRR